MEYSDSLVHDCLQDPSKGCSLTIAMGAQIPERDVFLLSTLKTRGDNAGFILNSVYGQMVVYWYTGLTSYDILATGTLMGLKEWNHIAFAYQNTAGTPEVELYINFEATPVQNFSSTEQTEFVPRAFMGSGLGEGPDSIGFGIIDELLVFPEYLSSSQIAQLKDSSN